MSSTDAVQGLERTPCHWPCWLTEDQAHSHVAQAGFPRGAQAFKRLQLTGGQSAQAFTRGGGRGASPPATAQLQLHLTESRLPHTTPH